jgi:carboxyl-terminal processing protease
VYGGGGIAPDVKYETPKSTKLQDILLQNYAFFNFAKHYLLNHHVARNFVVDDNMLQEFRHFLDDQKIAYTEAELMESDSWLRTNIKSELFIGEFGQQEGLRVRAEEDPEVVRALDLLPKARELADNARRVIAEHNAARAGSQ